MAAKKSAKGVNKSEFIRGVLSENAAAKPADVVAAWKDAGHREDLNPTLYYQVKRSMGLSKGRRRKKGRKAAVMVGAPAATNGSGSGYLDIERSLDQLIGQAAELRDNKLTEALRGARRLASTKLV